MLIGEIIECDMRIRDTEALYRIYVYGPSDAVDSVVTGKLRYGKSSDHAFMIVRSRGEFIYYLSLSTSLK
jgi:hypothetical protein